MFAVVLLKAYTSSVEHRESGFSAAIWCSSLKFQLLPTRHPLKKPLLLSRRMSSTTLVYRDPRIPERPYCPLRGHDFPLRPQPPQTMLSDLLSPRLFPPEGRRGQVCSIREASVNSCLVSTNQSQHHLTHFPVKSLSPFLSLMLSSVYRTSIRRGTCAEETRHRLLRLYPGPGLKRRWFRH